MKHGPGGRRGRSRGNGKRHPSSFNRNFESSGPDIKVRGTAHQVLEKYLALARDAASVGDRVSAENYLQHAEHYYRIINAEHAARPHDGQNRFPGAQPVPGTPAAGTPASAAHEPRSGDGTPGASVEGGPGTPSSP
jgi:hypothetical protein